MSVSTAEALALLERVAYDLRQGWPEAALDAAGRAAEALRALLEASAAGRNRLTAL